MFYYFFARLLLYKKAFTVLKFKSSQIYEYTNKDVLTN